MKTIERNHMHKQDHTVIAERKFRTDGYCPLFDEIVAEYFFAALENAAMQSFYSENLSRFRTMEAAHQNIETKTEELTRLARRLRQEAVTTEILDLIGGTKALSSS